MKHVLVVVAILIHQVVIGQNRLSDHNTIGWFTTTITSAFTKDISGHIEYQWRRDNLVTDWQQSLLRVGVNYHINPHVTLHLGYGWIETFAYGDHTLSAVPKQFPEHRLYQQLVVNTPVGKTRLQHRLRLEQRWLGRLQSIASDGADEYVYLNRARYMPRLDVPLSAKWYAALYDEIFIGFGKNVGENVFDQNRIGIMLGCKLSPVFRVEGGFINQVVQLGREVNQQNVFQYNNGFILNTYINF